MYQPIDWLYNNQDSNIDVDIMYFSLEMSKESKMLQAMSYRLYDKYKISISPQKLKSVFEEYVLEDEIIQTIEAERDWFEFFESKVTFYDHVRNPYGIYLTVKNRFEEDGIYKYKLKDFVNNSTGQVTQEQVVDRYIPNNPDKFRIVITDHISLLQPEKIDNGSIYNAIGRFSSRYCLEMRDKWGATICNVQQQAATSEEEHWTSFGKSTIEKVKPSAAALGDNKSTARDADLMLSLFHPARYNQKIYQGIDLTEMNDSHRELFINLNRHGINNAKIQLVFNGASNHFEEIEKNEILSVYYKLKNIKHK